MNTGVRCKKLNRETMYSGKMLNVIHAKVQFVFRVAYLEAVHMETHHAVYIKKCYIISKFYPDGSDILEA